MDRTQPAVSLREVTRATVRTVCALALAPGQERFVAPNAVSIAEAYFEPKAWIRAIYAGDEPVGFLMLYDDPGSAEYILWRLMVAGSHQGKGYGRRAVELVIDHVRGRPGATELKLSVVPGDGSAFEFYRGMGFEPTGEMDGNEIVLRLPLAAESQAGPAVSRPRPGTSFADPLSGDAVLQLLLDLVRIPSVNPSLVPEEGTGEAAVASFSREWLRSRGVRAWLEETAPGRPNCVAEIGSGEGRTLVLCGHLDTVGIAGMSAPFDPVVDGSTVHGRGTYDMKGGVAAMMAATASLARDQSLQGRLLLALVTDEEYASIGADHFVGRHSAEGCIVGEPTEGRLIVAHRGFVWLDVITRGRIAHGSRWDMGQSAIGRMGRIASALEEFDRTALRARSHPLTGPASLHCAVIRGGVGPSTYAPECRMRVERRTLPGEDGRQAAAEVDEVIRRAGEVAEVRLEFERAPLESDPGSPIAGSVRAAAAAVTGLRAEDAGVAYWMDTAVFAAAGIPSIGYGPSGAGAHEDEEWVDLDSVVSCARVIAEAARRFCATPPDSRIP
jgi:acetylornithine deacetylase